MDIRRTVIARLLDVMEAEADESMYACGLMSDATIQKLADAALSAVRRETAMRCAEIAREMGASSYRCAERTVAAIQREFGLDASASARTNTPG